MPAAPCLQVALPLPLPRLFDYLPPAGVEVTHTNLNDGCCEGLRAPDLRAFSVQYHPEAAPGPHDAAYLFGQFVALMKDGSM